MEETFKVTRAYGESGTVHSVEWEFTVSDGVETAVHGGVTKLENPVAVSAGEDAVEAEAIYSISASTLDNLRSLSVKHLNNAAYGKEVRAYPEIYFSESTMSDVELSVRAKRDELLAQTDWVSAKAYDTGVDEPAWKAYRQALRDITAQPGFPEEVTWPTKPE